MSTLNGLWLRGELRHRPGRLVATTIGVALTVAFVASFTAFLDSARASMTVRAISTVPIDLQVEADPFAEPATVASIVAKQPGIEVAEPVQYATSTGLTATTGASTQTTGPGAVLGLSPSYFAAFPGVARVLSGNLSSGAVVTQQTAANLHVAVGDEINIGRADMTPLPSKVGAVVDLQAADLVFEPARASSTAPPTAPPDNVVILPAADWHRGFDPLVGNPATGIRTQVHAQVRHDLPGDPTRAYDTETQRARNLEAQLAGSGTVKDNLANTLDKTRGDALYAQLLFLYLGLPALVLAAILVVTAAGATADRRRREHALLRARGASNRVLLGLAVTEGGFVAISGTIIGTAIALPVSRLLDTSPSRSAWITSLHLGAIAIGAVGAFAIGAFALVVPVWREVTGRNVTATRRAVPLIRPAPPWARRWLDVLALGIAAVLVWRLSANGFQVVTAPEGTPQVSVDYWSFIPVALFWVGAGLLVFRLTELLLRRGQKAVKVALSPIAGGLATTTARSMGRQRFVLARSVTLLALALMFAVSTATFNATYRRQAEADAVLTNGADVRVQVNQQAAPAEIGPVIESTPGVDHVVGIQHRFAYVGSDLQDLYGIDPSSTDTTTAVKDAYFRGGSARELLGQLQAEPSGVLVSAETVADYQLNPGDTINLRLQHAGSLEYQVVPFRYVGVVKEFPTAPSDSFVVANASYVAAQTGDAAVGTYLVDTSGSSKVVATRLSQQLGAVASVTDITDVRGKVGASLTAVSLDGLTTLELAFAVLLALAAGGLILWLRLNERRRAHAVITALGGTPGQLRRWLFSETGLVTFLGIFAGLLAGSILASMLVKLLTGVFDPAPDQLAVPVGYLSAVLLVIVIAAIVGVLAAARRASQSPAALLRAT